MICHTLFSNFNLYQFSIVRLVSIKPRATLRYFHARLRNGRDHRPPLTKFKIVCQDLFLSLPPSFLFAIEVDVYYVFHIKIRTKRKLRASSHFTKELDFGTSYILHIQKLSNCTWGKQAHIHTLHHYLVLDASRKVNEKLREFSKGGKTEPV